MHFLQGKCWAISSYQRILPANLRAIHLVGWCQRRRRRGCNNILHYYLKCLKKQKNERITWKGTWSLADGTWSWRSFGSGGAWRFLQMMANGDGRASDGMRIGQLLLIGAFDGDWFARESQWPALGSDVAAGRTNLLPAFALRLASVAETTDGGDGYQE